MVASEKIKSQIKAKLSSRECRELSRFCEKLAIAKDHEEHEEMIKSLGIGGQIVVKGGSSETARLGMGGLVGTIVRFGPKRVRVKLGERREWLLPYRLLAPGTEENIRKEQESVGLGKTALSVANGINAMLGEK